MCSFPLSGVRVLDLTHYIAGPYCTKLFADLGADVVKIEKPERGDEARWLHPFIGDKPHPEKSPLFLYLNTSKRSVVLDLKTTGGIATFKELVQETDILVENFRPGVMTRLGIDYPTLERLNPRLVMTSISNFGQDGPYRDWAATELTFNALSGMMSMTGRRDREPIKLGLSQVQYSAGVAAAVATLATYRYQQMTGYGQYIDVSVLEPFFNMLHQQLVRYSYLGELWGRGTIEIFPFVFETKDGWIHVSQLQLPDLVDILSHSVPELKAADYTDPQRLEERLEKVAKIMESWFRQQNTLQAVEELQLQGINAAPVYSEAGLLSCPQLGAREYFVEVKHPVAGWAQYPGRYFVCDQIEKMETRPAPLLGQHSQEVLDESEQRRQSTTPTVITDIGAKQRNGNTMPLSDVRILSLEHWAALPHTTKYLASLGAQVIVVESPARPPQPPGLRGTVESGGLFIEGARSKLRITIDLAKPEGVDLFKRLVKISDAIVDNFTPRVMKNFGLDYESLRQVKSDIITLGISGFGRKGPWHLYRGYAITAEAASGLANLTGYSDGPPVRPGGTPLGDVVPALHAAWTLLTALEHRKRTGEGAEIDISMVEPCTSQIGEAIVNFSLTGHGGTRMLNRDLNAAPSGCYPCLGEDKWVTIAVCNEGQWQALVRVLGNPSWAQDERSGNKEYRLKHQDELDGRISEWTRVRDNMEVMKLCQEAGVPAGAVLFPREVLTNEHYMDRGSFEVVQTPPSPEGAGNRLHIAPPWRLSRTPANTLRSARIKLGEDNDYVFAGLLGLTKDDLTELETKGVISKVLTAQLPDRRRRTPGPTDREEGYMHIIGLQ